MRSRSQIASLGLLFCVGSGLLPAQVPALGGPVGGFLYDPPSRSIRPLRGVPGTAHLGPPVVVDVQFASVAPNGTRALAIKEDGLYFIPDLTAAEPLVQPVSGSVSGIEHAAWSRDSARAAVYASHAALLQVFTFSGLEAGVEWSRDLSSLEGEVTALAVHPAGSVILGMRAAEGQVYLVSSIEPPRPLAPIGYAAGFALDNRGDILFAVDRFNRSILELRGLQHLPSVEVMAEAVAEDAVGLALSGDDSRLYVAGRSSQLLEVYETDSRQKVQEIPLDFPPACVQPLAGKEVLLLAPRDRESAPVWLLENKSGERKVYFVPAALDLEAL
jgi:hypothetical protein